MSTEGNNEHPAEQADIRADLKLVLDGKTVTQAGICRESGVSQSAFSAWYAGKYSGDNEAIEGKLRIWIEGFRSRNAQGSAMPSAPDFVPTPTARRVLAALSYAQTAADIAVIYGGAGLGKTSAIRQYVRTGLNVWHVTMTPASASVVTAMEEICRALGMGDVGGAAKLHRAVCRKVANTNGLLVIDEAQHLSVQALDQIRSIHDATEIGIALVGNTEVFARMTGGNRAAYLDRLYSRVGKRLALQRSSNDDIDALIAAWGIDDGKCRASLIDIAKRPGALRTLTKVLRLSSMHATAEKAPLCCEHVARAWRELGGAE